jgi:hypothetical protein
MKILNLGSSKERDFGSTYHAIICRKKNKEPWNRGHLAKTNRDAALFTFSAAEFGTKL